MKVAWPVRIAGTGACVPDCVVANDQFTTRLDTSDEWIVQRTGIRERRMAAPEQSTLHLATAASRGALASAGIPATDLSLIVTATITPDYPLPSTACMLQSELGCNWIPAYDLVAACSGFVYSLITAAQFVANGLGQRALVVGAEIMTRMTDMEDRTSAILFGDGAGAAILERSDDPNQGILAVNSGADGGRAKLIWVPAGGAAEPASARTVNERLHFMRMRGREVYKFAVTQMEELIQKTVADAGVALSDVAMIVPHQSNLRIIESACERLAWPMDRVLVNIDRYGNTSAASVPLALHEAVVTQRIRRGDLVLLVAFGAGLTWASVLLRY